jgi:SAM-dependent methyltransferase
MPLEFDADRPPLPPADLMLRVSPAFDATQLEIGRSAFDEGAIAALRTLEAALGVVGHEFASFERLLDFGCGCGRYVRHLGPLSRKVEIHGVDIDAEMIAWMQQSIPFGSYIVGPHEPPLPYPDGHFDLVINHSVFTHIDERLQDLWLAELRRITRPDAIVLLTVEGHAVWNRALSQLGDAGEDVEGYRRRLEQNGILHIAEDQLVGSTHPPFYHSTFHAPWYVFEHWSEFFEIAGYLSRGVGQQDLLTLRRRRDDEPVPRPIGHRDAAQPVPAPIPVRPVQISAAPGPRMGPRRIARGVARRVRSRIDGSIRPPSPNGVARSTRLAALSTELAALSTDLAALSTELQEMHGHFANRDRAVSMLKVGLYEQGRRISVVAAELREEINQAPARSAPV